MTRAPSVAIIGGGFGGIATAVNLARAGLTSFTIFEQSEGVGGTWWDNRYPGCAVDIPSHAYSFSFMPYDWTSTHAAQPELQRYAEDVVDRFGLRPHLRLSTKVEDVAWDGSRYVVRTAAGERLPFDVVVSCVGLLNVPRYPDWPGRETFARPLFHTSRWEGEHDLAGKRVAVVGTGSTAAQVVPALAPIVGQLHVFQRQPGWIMPKGEREFTTRERERFTRYPLAQKLHRAQLFYLDQKRIKGFDAASKRQRLLRQAGLEYLERAIPDPELRALVTPDYPWGCKRVVYASDFYPALQRDNVELVPHAVERLTETGVVDATGVEREVDVLVLATGFQPVNFLASVAVRGEGGRELHDVWNGEAKAFLGITVPGFPNFFMVYGPNTNGGSSIIAQLERQAEFVARAVRRMARRDVVVDTRRSAMDRYVRWVDAQIAKHASVTLAGCTNYFYAASGRNVTQWPLNHPWYYAVTKLLPRLGLVERRRR